ncbi:MAG: D-alanyl-D-alanine carboxypeptidase/D-alanyl-D-alanine-endopeptidase [Prevotella sp.]|nr:D-alanyl-D-alanine carboxypeptidase/D-alanyl-D-alanine-endopeptidase [Prevotella sp.]
MKKYVLLLLIWALTMPMMGQRADTIGPDSLPPTPWPQSLRLRLDTVLMQQQPLLRTSELGLLVWDLTADSALYAVNPHHILRPASTMKLVTSITALDRLGGAYQFSTSLYYKGTIDGNTLNGDVICVGGMDPCFNIDDMHAFVEQLQRLGVDTICGRLVADKTMKDADTLGWGWCWDDDNPVLTPLLLQGKDNFMERFSISLRAAGITLQATQAEERLPAGATFVCKRFHTMDQVLMRMMKESDNLYAESMFYQLAAITGTKGAGVKQARTVIWKLIDKLGLVSADYKIADGSGLSLYNYLSPELEVRLLRYAWRNTNIQAHLLPSLPIAGQDGTLKKRMQKTAAAGNVHAKTGTVTGVSTLAGYCTAPNGHVLCFAIMNQGVLTASRARTFQDMVCIQLCQ